MERYERQRAAGQHGNLFLQVIGGRFYRGKEDAASQVTENIDFGKYLGSPVIGNRAAALPTTPPCKGRGSRTTSDCFCGLA